MTTSEAARILNTSPRQVRALIADKRLRATRRGRDWHITPGALRAVKIGPVGRPKGKG